MFVDAQNVPSPPPSGECYFHFTKAQGLCNQQIKISIFLPEIFSQEFLDSTQKQTFFFWEIVVLAPKSEACHKQ